jgi:ABC-type sugar transport system ATPase subunit
MSDRVLVMKDGEITAELSKDRVTEENILTHSIGDKAI